MNNLLDTCKFATSTTTPTQWFYLDTHQGSSYSLASVWMSHQALCNMLTKNVQTKLGQRLKVSQNMFGPSESVTIFRGSEDRQQIVNGAILNLWLSSFYSHGLPSNFFQLEANSIPMAWLQYLVNYKSAFCAIYFWNNHMIGHQRVFHTVTDIQCDPDIPHNILYLFDTSLILKPSEFTCIIIVR
jgi:hypothetical protein